MNLQDALERFLVQLEADGRSRHTIGQYRRHVRAFAAWLAQGGHGGVVGSIGPDLVARFVASPAARTAATGAPRRAVTMNAMRTSLRCFFGYLHAAGMVVENPARLLRRAMCGAPPPRALPEDEAARLLATIAAATGAAARRDHALFHLMLRAGIRVGSAVSLSVEDVDLDRAELTLRATKGDRPDRVFLPADVVEGLRAFVGDRTTGPLFAGPSGKRLTTRHVGRRLTAWGKAAGLKRTLSPHMLRHAFATNLLRRCQDVTVVQAALRHRSISSTLVYARVDEGRVRAAIG